MSTTERREQFLRDAERLLLRTRWCVRGRFLFVDCGGSWLWDRPDAAGGLYASPFWEGTEGLQFCWSYADADGEEQEPGRVVVFEPTGDLQADVERYTALVGAEVDREEAARRAAGWPS